MRLSSFKKDKIFCYLLIISLLIGLMSSCNRKNLPEPNSPPVSSSLKQENITVKVPNENILLENLLEMIDNKIMMNKLDKSKCYAVILNDGLLHKDNLSKYISSFISKSIPVVDNKDLKDILKVNKELVILEIRYEDRNKELIMKILAYSTYLMKYVFTIDYEVKIDYFEEIEKERRKEELYIEGEKEKSESIGIVNDEVLAIKVSDYNNDEKEDLLLLTPTKVYYWLMAYNIVLKEKSMLINNISKIKSRDLSGLIIKNMNILFLINSNMPQGLCIYDNDDVRSCELQEIDLFSKEISYDLVSNLGTNWFKLLISDEKEILFHTLYYIPLKMDADLEKGNDKVFIYYLGLDDRIYEIGTRDLEKVYVTPFKSGRAFTVNDEYLITSLSNISCPPDGINIYKKQNDGFSLLLSIKKDNDCITAIDLGRGNNKELVYYYSAYDKKTKVSRINYERTRID